MRTVNIVDFCELLSHGEKIGFSWNEAHQFLIDDNIIDDYHSRDYSIGDFKEEAAKSYKNKYGFSLNTIKLMKSFFEKYDVTSITLVYDK